MANALGGDVLRQRANLTPNARRTLNKLVIAGTQSVQDGWSMLLKEASNVLGPTHPALLAARASAATAGTPQELANRLDASIKKLSSVVKTVNVAAGARGTYEVNLGRFAGLAKLAPETLLEWMARQEVFGTSKTPLAQQDILQRIQAFEIAESVLRSNPLLTAEKDDWGIAPGTHLASPFQEMPSMPFMGRGLGALHDRLGNLKLILPGWGDASKGLKRFTTAFHHSVYLGNGYIVHVGGGGVNRMRAGNQANYVGLDTLALGSLGGKGLYEVEHGNPLPRHQALFNAVMSIGKWKYDQALKNCEHFASEVTTGRSFSAQIARAVPWVALGESVKLGKTTLLRTSKVLRRVLTSVTAAAEASGSGDAAHLKQEARKVAAMTGVPAEDVAAAVGPPPPNTRSLVQKGMNYVRNRAGTAANNARTLAQRSIVADYLPQRTKANKTPKANSSPRAINRRRRSSSSRRNSVQNTRTSTNSSRALAVVRRGANAKANNGARKAGSIRTFFQIPDTAENLARDIKLRLLRKVEHEARRRGWDQFA